MLNDSLGSRVVRARSICPSVADVHGRQRSVNSQFTVRRVRDATRTPCPDAHTRDNQIVERPTARSTAAPRSRDVVHPQAERWHRSCSRPEIAFAHLEKSALQVSSSRSLSFSSINVTALRSVPIHENDIDKSSPHWRPPQHRTATRPSIGQNCSRSPMTARHS